MKEKTIVGIEPSECSECGKERPLQRITVNRILTSGKEIKMYDKWLCFPCVREAVKQIRRSA